MVLSLRVVRPDPIKTTLDKFAKEFSDSMKMWSDQYFPDTNKSSPNSEQEHHRKALVSGYTQEEDCFCVSTKTMVSDYDDLDGAVVEFEEEKGYQNLLQIQQDDDLFVHRWEITRAC